jgi:hypothetical protein
MLGVEQCRSLTACAAAHLIREDSGRLNISVKGRDFLTHLTRIGYRLNKVG